jgi:hypothetical protein
LKPGNALARSSIRVLRKSAAIQFQAGCHASLSSRRMKHPA